MDTVIIVPENGELKKIAQQLLALADDRKDVDYVMWPEPGFRVPVELADKFVKFRETSTAEVPAASEVEDAPAEPVKRKPGRPKKNVEDQ